MQIFHPIAKGASWGESSMICATQTILGQVCWHLVGIEGFALGVGYWLDMQKTCIYTLVGAGLEWFGWGAHPFRYLHLHLPVCKLVVISERKHTWYEGVGGKLGIIVQSLKVLGLFKDFILITNIWLNNKLQANGMYSIVPNSQGRTSYCTVIQDAYSSV